MRVGTRAGFQSASQLTSATGSMDWGCQDKTWRLVTSQVDSDIEPLKSSPIAFSVLYPTATYRFTPTEWSMVPSKTDPAGRGSRDRMLSVPPADPAGRLVGGPTLRDSNWSTGRRPYALPRVSGVNQLMRTNRRGMQFLNVDF